MKALIYRHGSYTYFICFREVPASMGIQKAKTYETKGNNVAMATTEQLNIEDLVIDHEFESVIPPLTQLEFDQLRKNILEDKEVFHPIIVWNKIIVDGHNRYKILNEHRNLPFRIKRLDFADRYEAIAWICKNQIGRRNLSEAQMTILMGRQYEAEKHSLGGDYTSEESRANRQNVGKLNGRSATAQKIANELGVSYRTVERSSDYVKALDIAKEHDANIERDILSGAITPSKQDVIRIGKATKDEVPQMVKQLREQKKRTVNKKTGSTISSISEMMAEDKPPATESDMLDSLQAAAKTLIRTFDNTFQYYPELLKNPEYRDSIKRIAQELIKYLNNIEGENT